MPYVYVEEDHGGSLLGILLGIAILLALARWEFEAFVILLPGMLTFLATTFVMCAGIIRLARRVCTDGRLDGLSDAGINPFGSVVRAADAILSALPPGLGRLVARPGAATSETVLAAGMGGLLAFGLSCWVTGALSTWQRTGRWDPVAPIPSGCGSSFSTTGRFPSSTPLSAASMKRSTRPDETARFGQISTSAMWGLAPSSGACRLRPAWVLPLSG